MAEYFKGTLLASPIVRGYSGDTYGTHHSVLGVGGFMEVKTITERNLIPPTGTTQITALGMSLNFDGISIGQRRLGMLVFVQSEGKVYQLSVPQVTWSGYTPTQKQNALANNSNWIEYVAGTLEPERITKTYTQTTHGFVVGDALGYNGTTFIKVASTGSTTAYPALGIVTENTNINTFKLTYVGAVSTSGMVDYTGGTLVSGTMYYVSSVAGKLTKLSPTAIGSVNRPILLKTSGTTGIVLEYRGTTRAEEGVDYGMFTGYTATTQYFLNKTVTGATNIGYFSGMTGVQTLALAGFPSAYNGNYYSQYNYFYRDCCGAIRHGSPSPYITCRRGYMNATCTYSWVYNTYTGSSQCVGWILVNGNILTNLGCVVTGCQYTGTPYTATTWAGFCSNGSTSVDATNGGSLWTGTTYNITGPVYRDKTYQNLNLRTICSCTPTAIRVVYDDSFIKLSGSSSNVGIFYAVNGLTKVGQYVILGGSLTGTTTISTGVNTLLMTNTGGECFYINPSGVFLYGCSATACQGTVSVENGCIRLLQCSGTQMDVFANNAGLYYDGNYSTLSGFTARTLVDAGYVTGRTCSAITGATNGLTKAGRQVKLGGVLTASTTNICLPGSTNLKFSGSTVYRYIDYNQSSDNLRLGWGNAGGCFAALVLCNTTTTLYTQCNTCVASVMTCSLDNKILFNGAGSVQTCHTTCGLYYTADYSSTSTERWIPDKRYVDCSLTGGSLIKKVVRCFDNNYTMSNNDYFVGTCSGRTVYLPPSPKCGAMFTVADVCGSASNTTSRCVTVNGNSYQILNSNNALINTCWGSVSFIFNGNNFSVIGFTAAPTYTL